MNQCIATLTVLLGTFALAFRQEVHGRFVAMTVASSLIGVVLFGSVVGSMLPFLLRRAGFDPAVASAPFVATVVDVTGLVIYFTIAYQILHGTLL